MALAKASDTTTEIKKARARSGRVLVRPAKTGPLLQEGKSGVEAEFVLKQKSVQTLRNRPVFVRQLLERVAQAASEAERSGEAIDLTIKVTPDASEAATTSTLVRGDSLDRALAEARGRGAFRVADILKSPDMLSARAFGPLVDMSHETVNQKRKAGEILGLTGATRGNRFPRWQVTQEGLPLPGLKTLFEALGGDPWTIYRFLLQRHNELAGETALDALKAGRVEAVAGVARNISQGAFA
ncbi:MAG: hypothetical protein M3T55_08985 [Pseudomonadota bacterium]|nr:hypothetical protein [Pseudomonadota bacterium]